MALIKNVAIESLWIVCLQSEHGDSISSHRSNKSIKSLNNLSKARK